jgi:hypothetical protein
VIPGFGDQREIELRWSRPASPGPGDPHRDPNGATFLGRQDQIGLIAAGKNADLVVAKGDPAAASRTSRMSKSSSATASGTTEEAAGFRERPLWRLLNE